MSDAAQNLDQENNNNPVVAENAAAEENKQDNKQEEQKPSYEDLEKRLNAVLSKHDELLTETKNAKREKQRIAEEQKEKEKKLAEKNGEYEKLWKTASEEKEQLMQKLKDIQNSNRQERLNSQAMKIAAELADGSNAELLSEFVKRKLENVAEDDGMVGDDVIEAVASEFKNNEKYKSLLRGSKASGGGAPGNLRSDKQQSNKMSRSEFDKLPPARQMEFIKKGGRTYDE